MSFNTAYGNPQQTALTSQEFGHLLVASLWEYRRRNFAGRDGLFDALAPSTTRPPVFVPGAAHLNVLTRPGASDREKHAVWGKLPDGKRHKWFRSLKSSQALAQSVFANLEFSDKFGLLANISGENGLPLFIRNQQRAVELDYTVTYLSEPRPSQMDVLIAGSHRVAVECKLAETEVGSCSRPRLTPADANFVTDYCNGTYTRQRGRKTHCTLTEIGVAYWKYISALFNWDPAECMNPCPLRDTYQLVRTVLAACVRPDGTLDSVHGHAVLLHDARNPAFLLGGKGRRAYDTVHAALKEPCHLQLCTWQRVVDVLRTDPQTRWLAEAVNEKYGL